MKKALRYIRCKPFYQNAYDECSQDHLRVLVEHRDSRGKRGIIKPIRWCFRFSRELDRHRFGQRISN